MKNYFFIGLSLFSFISCSVITNVENGSGKKYALIYGVNEGLKYPGKDAIELNNTLFQYGYEVTLRIDSIATKDLILGDIENMASRLSSEDLLLFYFAGHGNSEYIVSYGGNLVNSEELAIRFSKLKTEKVVVMFDHCFSGSHITKNTKYIVITAGTEEETAFEFGEPINHGIFTYYLIKGLSNKNADFNYDMAISLSELYSYANRHVTAFTTLYAEPQHPQFVGNLDVEIVIVE
jgi:hypothetical protein